MWIRSTAKDHGRQANSMAQATPISSVGGCKPTAVHLLNERVRQLSTSDSDLTFLHCPTALLLFISTLLFPAPPRLRHPPRSTAVVHTRNENPLSQVPEKQDV
ncbi:hypothetical protein GN956_G7303 [Arapaima gigas]